MVDEMRGKGVAQHVRREPLARDGARAVAPDEMPEGLPRHRPAARRDEQGVGGRISALEITLDPVHRFFTQRHEPLLRTLAEHAHHAGIQVHLEAL